MSASLPVSTMFNTFRAATRLGYFLVKKMTAQTSIARPSSGRTAVRSCQFITSLRGRPRAEERRDTHQIVRDDAKADVADRAVHAVIATAAQAVPTFDHTNPAFAADAPALAATKPALAFMRAAGRCLATGPRQDDTSDAALHGRRFVRCRSKAAIARREVRGTVKQRQVPIEGRHTHSVLSAGRRSCTSYAVMIWCSDS